MARDFDPSRSGYNEVANRIVEARKKFPEGRLQPADPNAPFRVETIGDKTFVVYVAAFYRTPDDPLPGIGVAWEPFPGTTPYTRNAELMNAETSAWGRALVAAFAADAKKGIASAMEIRNRHAERPERQPPAEQEWPAATDVGAQPVSKGLLSRLSKQFEVLGATSRDEVQMAAGLLIGVKVASPEHLTNRQAQRLANLLDPLTRTDDPPAALNKALQEAVAAAREENR